MVDATPQGFNMSEEIFDKSLKFFDKAKPKVIFVSGGEPTLHPRFEEICTEIKSRYPDSFVGAFSNGSFIFDKKKTDTVRVLTKIGIKFSIRTHPIFYPNYEKTMAEKEKLLEIGCEFFNDGIDGLIRLGRARSAHLDYASNGCQCANTVLTAKQSISGSDWLLVLESIAVHLCKPSIGIDGTIYAGETRWCQPIGHVDYSTLDTLYKRAKEFNPLKCNKCNGLDKIKQLNKRAYDFMVGSQS
jgi:hypothetical protein